MFELEHEAFGLRFPERISWAGCSPLEKERLIAACMEIYVRIVETYAWDALAVYWPWSDPDGVAAAKKVSGMPLENYEYMLDVFREFNARHAPA